jgi:hypothetical protein
LGTEGDEVVEGDGLGGDEAAFEIAVDNAGRRGGFVAGADGPGAGFFGSCREIGAESEQG